MNTPNEAGVGAVSSVLAEGKTKRILAVSDDNNSVYVTSKDTITAGDGARRDEFPGKGVLANQTTCNVFRLLQACGLPVAFTEQISDTAFLAPRCTMFPYEVVVRREAHGSCLKRMPHLHPRHIFPQLVVEFFLKTSGKRWQEYELPCDDPLMQCDEKGEIALYDPAKPIHQQGPFRVLSKSEVFTLPHEATILEDMKKIARRAFLILEKAWQSQGRTLADFKVEFGRTHGDKLLLADVIDNDSWRVVGNDGRYIDKQVYRDGAKLSDVEQTYRLVADLTGRFSLPRQQIVICFADDDVEQVSPLQEALHGLCGGSDAGEQDCPLVISTVSYSFHEEPIANLQKLRGLVQQVPDTVVIVFGSRRNDSGLTLSASIPVPVISAPLDFKKSVEAVFPALKTPPRVPLTTVLNPANAAMAAIRILAMHNPLLHMFLQEPIEKRLENVTLL